MGQVGRRGGVEAAVNEQPVGKRIPDESGVREIAEVHRFRLIQRIVVVVPGGKLGLGVASRLIGRRGSHRGRRRR